MQEFLEKGFKSASLRNIVKTAGVTTGALYGYYEMCIRDSPYKELERISAVHTDGTKTDIILDGRFVLAGLDELNRPLDEK